LSTDRNPWWRGATLYQIYPLSFADSNGDGWGDLPGITQRLDYVASLGVDGIWLSPFYEGAYADFGYDTTDQKRVDPRCGTLDDFDALLAKAHRLGLKVIVDQVYTYTSNRHPWFQESRRSKDDAKADWYVWADAKADGAPPNNWISIFGGPAWEWDRSRRQYYMTHFLPGMPHLHVQNPEVQDALLDIGSFWLDRGVDGFRLDVINLAMVDDQLRDNPLAGTTSFAMPGDAQQQIYDRSRPENLDFVRRVRQLADGAPGRFLMGEVSEPDALSMAKQYTAGEDLLHSAYFVLGLGQPPLTAAGLRRELEGWTDREPSWPTWAFSNHDVVRGLTRCGGAAATPALARLLLALLVSARGNALLFQGDELGLPDGEVPFERLRDPATRRFYPDYLQRDGARTPMPWQAVAPHAGFSTVEPWLPVGRSHAELAVDRQEADPRSTLACARRLVALRRAEPALRTGAVRFLDLPSPLLGFDRSEGARRIRCVFNVSSQRVRVGSEWLGGATPLAAEGYSPGSGTLESFGFCIASIDAA
jgi:alpha-glucosidase